LHRHGDLAGSQHRRAPDILTTRDRHRIGGYHDPVTTGSVEPDHVPAARLVQPTDPDPLTDPGHVVAIDRFLGCAGGDRDCPRGEAPASFGPARSWQGDLKAIDALVLQIASARSHPAVTKTP
jgi:hypothetical protein